MSSLGFWLRRQSTVEWIDSLSIHKHYTIVNHHWAITATYNVNYENDKITQKVTLLDKFPKSCLWTEAWSQPIEVNIKFGSSMSKGLHAWLALNDTLSNPANFTPPMQKAYCVLHTAKQRRHVDVVKIAEFLSECSRAKCFFSESSKPNKLIR